MTQMEKCEECEVDKPTRICASFDQPALAFCETCYKKHVQGAHEGKELFGSAKIRWSKKKVTIYETQHGNRVYAPCVPGPNYE